MTRENRSVYTECADGREEPVHECALRWKQARFEVEFTLLTWHRRQTLRHGLVLTDRIFHNHSSFARRSLEVRFMLQILVRSGTQLWTHGGQKCSVVIRLYADNIGGRGSIAT